MGMCKYVFPVLFLLILPGDDNLSSCGPTKQLLDTKDVIRLNVSEDLVLTLPETEPVRLYYTGKNLQDVELCTVSNNVLSCNNDFKDRVLFNAPNLTVRNMQPSDSGIYIIQKIDSSKIFQKVNVFVGEKGEILVNGNYHQPVTLQCNSSCSGSVEWIKNPGITVAECNQTSCHCQKGFEIPPERYLKQDFSLTITALKYNDVNTYYYWCSDGYEYAFNVTIKASNVSINLKPGDNLTLEVPNPDQVKVLCNQSLFYENADTCSPRNQSWTSKASACIKLNKVTPDDSGVYSVMDGETGNEYYIYKVSVEDQATGFYPDLWSFVLGLVVGVILIGIVCILLFVCYVRCEMCSNSSQESNTQQSNLCCLEMTNRSSTEQGSQNAPLMQGST